MDVSLGTVFSLGKQHMPVLGRKVPFGEREDTETKQAVSPALMECSPLDIPHWLQLLKIREFDYRPQKDVQL